MSSRPEKDSAMPWPAPSQQLGSAMPKHHMHAPPRNFAEELENNHHNTPYPSQRIDICNYCLSVNQLVAVLLKYMLVPSLSYAVVIRRRRFLFVFLKPHFIRLLIYQSLRLSFQ